MFSYYYTRRVSKRRINSRRVAICLSPTRDRANEERSGAQNCHITRRFWAWVANDKSLASDNNNSSSRVPLTTFERSRIKIGFRWLAEKSSRFAWYSCCSMLSLSLSLSWCRLLLPLASPNRCIYVRLIDSTSSSRRSDVPRRSGNTGEKVAIPLSTWLEINGSGRLLFSSSSSSSSSSSLCSLFFDYLKSDSQIPFTNSDLLSQQRAPSSRGARFEQWKIKKYERAEFVDWKLKFEGIRW